MISLYAMNKLHYVCLLVFCLYACTSGKETDSTQPYIVLEAQQDPLANVMRSQIDVNLASTFQSGDSIGLFNSDQTLSKWILTDSWHTENRPMWKELQKEATFYAFSPFVSKAIPTEVPLPDLTQQTGHLSAIRTYDFLWGSITTNYAAQQGLLAFTGRNKLKHLSALLTFELKTNVPEIPVVIHSVKLEGSHLFTQRHYNLLTHETVDASTEIRAHTFHLNQRIPSEGCVIACIINPTDKPLTLTINFERDGYKWSVSTQQFASIHGAGTWSKYTLLIQQKELTIEGNGIHHWEVYHWEPEIPIIEQLPDSLAQ